MTPAISILVQRDFAGIAAAFREMLEHQLARESAAAQGGPEASGLEFAGELAEGYYRWVEALLRFERRRAVNQNIALLSDYTDGLAALGRARAEFAADHPPCPRCDTPLFTAQDTFCWRCQHSWKEEASR